MARQWLRFLFGFVALNSCAAQPTTDASSCGAMDQDVFQRQLITAAPTSEVSWPDDAIARWSSPPSLWMADPLRNTDATSLYRQALDEAGFPMSLASDPGAATFRIFAYSSSRATAASGRGEVLCGSACMRHGGGSNPVYGLADSFETQLMPPVELMEEDGLLQARPRWPGGVRFEGTNMPGRTNVDGVVWVDATFHIVAADCFVNIDLPAQERRSLIAECFARGLGLIAEANSGASALLAARETPFQTMTNGHWNQALRCIRGTYGETPS